MRARHLLSGLSAASLAAGQTASTQIAPSNSTQRADSVPFPALNLEITENGANSTFALDSAFARVSAGSDVQAHLLQKLSLGGPIRLTANASDAAKLDSRTIGYVSCDASAYKDTKELDALLSAAATAIGNSSALVFYSRTSARCSIDSPGPFSATSNLFTMTNATAAKDLATRLQSGVSATAAISNARTGTSGAPPASRTSAAATGNGSGDGSSDFMSGGSPGATVAMIVLYIITGLITLGFISVIVAGAVRAHRHPEWYHQWDQQGGGGRRRVLGRAILDSIPIIKFGESATATKTAESAADVELEDGSHQTQPRPASADPQTTQRRHESPDTVEVQPASCPLHAPSPAPFSKVKAAGADEEAIKPAITAAAAASPAAGDIPESEALECAICVEPFQQGDDMRVLPQCEHKFHPACLDPWLLNVSSTCPLCRLDLHPPAEPTHSLSSPSNAVETTETSTGTGGEPLWLIPTDRPGVYQHLDPRTMPAVPSHNRRSTGRLVADVWTRLLSRQRLRDASPQERVVALRELREARRRASQSQSESQSEGANLSGGGGGGGGENRSGVAERGDNSALGNSVIAEEDQHEPHPTTTPSERPALPRRADRLSRMFGRRPAFPSAAESESASEPAPEAEVEADIDAQSPARQ